MTKIKAILIGVAVLFVMGLLITVSVLRSKKIKLETENARLEFNNFQLMRDNDTQIVLYLKEKEVSGKLKRERDSIAASLKIKPKQIEKIIYQTNTIIDTFKVEVPVYLTTKNFWKISDTINKCTIYNADLRLVKDSLYLTRTGFYYNNKATEAYYKKRSRSFLGIKFGKWIYHKELSSECGKTQQTTFNFIK